MNDTRYRISFPAGFRTLVERLAKRDFGIASVVDGDDSSLLLRPENEFKAPVYAQTAALVMDTLPCGSLEEAFKSLAFRLKEENPRRELARVFRDKAFMRNGRADRFVVRGFVRNEPAFPGAEGRTVLENAVSRLTDAKPDSNRPDVDLSVAIRDDGKRLFHRGDSRRSRRPRMRGRRTPPFHCTAALRTFTAALGRCLSRPVHGVRQHSARTSANGTV